ncbi:hypothetical protein IMCC1989_1351 [gamma proteobacterium IMCC1989]|nr:hypothetical protein IMCC1989_1351 [gamma proteobacterium IMCC1989]
MNSKENLLNQLIERGDRVDIYNGKLVITPKSGIKVPENWQKENRNNIACCISKLTGIEIYLYESFSVGKYDKGTKSGITINFHRASDMQKFFTIMNIKFERQRNSKKGKKGDRLPNNEFVVTDNMMLYEFWKRTGLKIPQLTRFNQYMGNLKDILFVADIKKGNKFENPTIRPTEVNHEEILKAHNRHTENTQKTLKAHITTTHKETPESLENQALEEGLTTCKSHHGNTLIRECGNKIIHDALKTSPQEQDIEEWLAPYNETSN